MQLPKKKIQKDWFKDRGYLHLTNRINIRDKYKVETYIADKQKVVSHKFLPLILRQTTTRRYKYSEDLKKRSHKSVDKKGNLISNAKVRPIMYATHIDSHIYSYYSHKIIYPLYESRLKACGELNKSITAYRQIETDDKVRFKYNVDFAKEVFDEIKVRGECAVLALDIKNFFPSLNHKQLKAVWSQLLGTKSLPKDHYAIYKSITNYSYFYYDDLRLRKNGCLDEKKLAKLKNKGKFQLFENYKSFLEKKIKVYKNSSKVNNIISGIPQGLPISAMLANLYMLPFDKNIIELLVKGNGCFYRRYSDDLVIVCDTKDIHIVESIVNEEIKRIKLEISKSKTEKVVFEKHNDRLECYKLKGGKKLRGAYLQYLGFDFYGYKTLIKSANISRFYREMKESIKMKSNRVKSVQSKYLTDDRIIFKRKILRLYSFRGINSRYLPAQKLNYINGHIESKKFKRKYRGNFLKYAYRASEIMEAPEIKRQVRRHMIILKSYMKQYDFNNVK